MSHLHPWVLETSLSRRGATEPAHSGNRASTSLNSRPPFRVCFVKDLHLKEIKTQWCHVLTEPLYWPWATNDHLGPVGRFFPTRTFSADMPQGSPNMIRPNSRPSSVPVPPMEETWRLISNAVCKREGIGGHATSDNIIFPSVPSLPVRTNSTTVTSLGLQTANPTAKRFSTHPPISTIDSTSEPTPAPSITTTGRGNDRRVLAVPEG